MILGRLYDFALWPHPWPWTSTSESEIPFSQDVSHPFMTMILTSVTMVGWEDVPDSDRVTSGIGVPSTHLVCNSFILSNFNYCPLAWHFCGKTNNQKLERLQDRSLRILYCDYISRFQDLLENTSSQSSTLMTRIKCILIEVFKSLNQSNAASLHDMFKK